MRYAMLALVGVMMVAGCGGGGGGGGQDGQAGQDRTGLGAGVRAPASDSTASPAALLALGDSVFHGTIGGAACTVCHGQDASGTTSAPDLTDAVWLHGDGSRAFIARIVREGVSAPKKFPSPMPPMGGASLTPEQIEAVAAYVYARSHPG